MKRLGVLTSGGDCAGLNAAIRAVVKRAVTGHGAEVVGILQGTKGLMERPVRTRPLDLSIFTGDILRQGGTMLGTVNTGDPFAFPDGRGGVTDRSAEVLEGIRGLDIDALIGIGGDGSMRILRRLADQGGIPFVGIPKTIDNDVPGTEMCIGYHTAVATAVEALDRLQPTAASHQRVMVLEVMGRDAGHIALAAGIAGGADVILIPEVPYDTGAVAAKLASVAGEGRNHALVVCAEAARPRGGAVTTRPDPGGTVHYGGAGQVVGAEIAEATGADVRVTVLGHVQRGGMPTSIDRLLASAFGVHAVDLAAAKRTGRMVGWRGGDTFDTAFEDLGPGPRCVDLEGSQARTARGLGISLGDR
ncbi:MAG: 6-phosphofructokinase [Rhodospirillales bacterium CG15_BIG_FIL_POST_REV_8_21_14_020_66_15]|nr:MAG: 6-phosphofructokinase [Rhodospirillales bacterium CG15_BIG_FIL_POST_REV_8_21_14_020_66_15]